MKKKFGSGLLIFFLVLFVFFTFNFCLFYANAVPNSWLSYSANTGGGPPVSVPPGQYVPPNTTITLSSMIPVRNGYEFLGWAKSPTATEPEYFPGGEFYMGQGSVILCAVWRKIEVPPPHPQDITPSTTKVTATADGTAFRGFTENTTVDAALSYFEQDNSYLQIKDADENILEGGDIVGTGCTINLVVNEAVEASYTNNSNGRPIRQRNNLFLRLYEITRRP